jgi:hypothetical protein
MKKTIAFSRLVLKRETLRTLDNMRLEGVRGGSDEAPVMDSGAGDTCPALGAIARQQIGG